MATQASTAELVAALRRIDGKAEIVAGEIVVIAAPALPGWTFPVDDLFE
jgi:hypothetical protein